MNNQLTNAVNNLALSWAGSAVGEESTLHQISPYLGKTKSSMANALIRTYTSKGEVLYDPFSGSGTIPLEGWLSGRNVVANDLSAYGFVLSKAKLYPPRTLQDALLEINKISSIIESSLKEIDLRKIPKWVRSFFHQESLREIIAWTRVLSSKNSYFLLSCLMGILHHQRPGFLSYPSSHAVPYLRDKLYPKEKYPELYQYRSLQDRLEKKIRRAFKRVPQLNRRLKRECYGQDVLKLIPKQPIDAIITSPPYMSQLDYGRDNRLRLYFLGTVDWKGLDKLISPQRVEFVSLMEKCLRQWKMILNQNGVCVLILGNIKRNQTSKNLADIVSDLATNTVGGYSLENRYTESIPSLRRVRRHARGSLSETILVLKKFE